MKVRQLVLFTVALWVSQIAAPARADTPGVVPPEAPVVRLRQTQARLDEIITAINCKVGHWSAQVLASRARRDSLGKQLPGFDRAIEENVTQLKAYVRNAKARPLPAALIEQYVLQEGRRRLALDVQTRKAREAALSEVHRLEAYEERVIQALHLCQLAHGKPTDDRKHADLAGGLTLDEPEAISTVEASPTDPAVREWVERVLASAPAPGHFARTTKP